MKSGARIIRPLAAMVAALAVLGCGGGSESGQGNANPMTCLAADGRQYVAVTATEELLAFRLP